MKLEQQVCSMKLAKRLRELGVKQKSLFWWVGTQVIFSGASDGKAWYKIYPFNSDAIDMKHRNGALDFSAFTVAELGEILPPDYYTYRHPVGESEAWFGSERGTQHMTPGDTEANVRAQMIIDFLENKLIP